jgi:hypothetical protein
MPLQAGKSKAAFSANVSELMRNYAAKGTIGNSAPASKAKALKQSLAIAYAQKRKTIAHGR